MAERLFAVTVKAPLLENGTAQERLIRAEKQDAVVEYLLAIKRASADDVARLMAAGVKVEGPGK